MGFVMITCCFFVKTGMGWSEIQQGGLLPVVTGLITPINGF